MNTTCDRCYTMRAPMEIIQFSYCGSTAVGMCLACLKIVLANLMALPLDIRVEHLQRWQALWQEERRGVAG